MKRNYRVATKPGHRICNRCENELPATAEVFLRDKGRPLGLAYECRDCHRTRRAGRDRRPERWKNLTAEQRLIVRARQQRYAKTNTGRALFLRKSYERVDACDLSTAQIAAIIVEPCVYCGTVETPRGLDRIDNAKAHVAGNVLPCCPPCNFARGNRFTMEEMKIIGAAIRQVMDARHQG